MVVVGVLGGGVDHQSPVGVHKTGPGIGLQVVVFDHRGPVCFLDHTGTAGKGTVRIPPADTAGEKQVALGMDFGRVRLHGLEGVADNRQRVVCHHNGRQSLQSGCLGFGSYQGHGIGNRTHLVGRQQGLVLVDDPHQVPAGNVRGGKDPNHPFDRQGFCDIYRNQLGMILGASKGFKHQGAFQRNVGGEHRRAFELFNRSCPWNTFANHFEFLFHISTIG